MFPYDLIENLVAAGLEEDWAAVAAIAGAEDSEKVARFSWSLR